MPVRTCGAILNAWEVAKWIGRALALDLAAQPQPHGTARMPQGTRAVHRARNWLHQNAGQRAANVARARAHTRWIPPTKLAIHLPLTERVWPGGCAPRRVVAPAPYNGGTPAGLSRAARS